MSLLTTEQIYTLDSLGLVVVRNIIPREQIDLANRVIETSLKNKKNGKFSVLEMDPVFFSFMSNPWILSACEQMLGPNFRFDHAFGLQQPGENLGANLHGGPLTCQGANYYVSNQGEIRCGRISIGIMLTRQDKDSGGFVFIPGSHKSVFPYHGNKVLSEVLPNRFDSECIQCPTLDPGDLVCFVDSLVHGTSDWKKDSKRRALYYMYSPGFVSWRPHEHVAKYLAMATTDVQRRLLEPPYVSKFSDDDFVNNWRSQTI